MVKTAHTYSMTVINLNKQVELNNYKNNVMNEE